MSLSLKRVKDPEGLDMASDNMPETMTLRPIETYKSVDDGSGKHSKKKTDPSPDAQKVGEKESKKPRVKEHFKCEDIIKCISDSVDEEGRGMAYYIGTGDKKVFCGPVLQVVPRGGFATIGSGECVVSKEKPFNGENYLIGRDKQILIEVNGSADKDGVVVMGKNGCVLLESSSCAVFNLPVFVIQKNGEYYCLRKGRRALKLDPGLHFVVYAKQIPIIFTTVTKSVVLPKLPPGSMGSMGSMASNQPISHTDSSKTGSQKESEDSLQQKSNEDYKGLGDMEPKQQSQPSGAQQSGSNVTKIALFVAIIVFTLVIVGYLVSRKRGGKGNAFKGKTNTSNAKANAPKGKANPPKGKGKK